MYSSFRKSILCCALLLSLILVSMFMLKKTDVAENEGLSNKDYHSIEYQGDTYRYNSDIVPVVFIGTDRYEESDFNGQADAIQVVLFDRKNEKIKCVSIPRDTLTDIKFYDAEQKLIGWTEDHISIAFAQGKNEEQGSRYVCDALSRLFNNIPLNYYCTVDLTQIDSIQSLVGEIDVKIPNASLEKVGSEWKKGNVVTITTDNVETFVRKRDTEEDFSASYRLERQKVYIQEYLKKIKGSLELDYEKSLIKVENLFETTTSNFSMEDLIDFADMLLNYSMDSEEDFITIPGENVKGYEYDEYHIDNNEFEKTIVDLFYVKKKG